MHVSATSLSLIVAIGKQWGCGAVLSSKKLQLLNGNTTVLPLTGVRLIPQLWAFSESSESCQERRPTPKNLESKSDEGSLPATTLHTYTLHRNMCTAICTHRATHTYHQLSAPHLSKPSADSISPGRYLSFLCLDVAAEASIFLLVFLFSLLSLLWHSRFCHIPYSATGL